MQPIQRVSPPRRGQRGGSIAACAFCNAAVGGVISRNCYISEIFDQSGNTFIRYFRRQGWLMAASGAALWKLIPSEVVAQGIDPGIAAIVSVLKTTLTTTPVPATTNGWTPFLDDAQSTTVTTVKGGAGELGAYHCLKPNSAAAYVQIFDTSSTVTLGTTIPGLTLGLPAGDGGNLEWTMSIHFANPVKVAATTTATGSTAPGMAFDNSFAFK
jgi:hypothetical protein